MKQAIEETERRRKIQENHNKTYGIIPKPIRREIGENLFGIESTSRKIFDLTKMSKEMSKEKLKEELTEEMLSAAKALNFEKAAELRDAIKTLNLYYVNRAIGQNTEYGKLAAIAIDTWGRYLK